MRARITAMGKAGEQAACRPRLCPGLCVPSWPSPGRSLLRRAGSRAVPWRHQGTGSARPVWLPSKQTMASTARRSGPWSPLLLRLPALLGMLLPQVRNGRMRSFADRVLGAGGGGAAEPQGAPHPPPGAGSPQFGPWPEKTP